MKKLIRTAVIALFVIVFTNIHAQVTTTFNPVADAHVNTFGGGQGENSFLKFDISSIPLGGEILSATLDVNVKSIKIWDGDVNFYNVNNQTWTEAELATDLYGYTRSDSTHQALGFGTLIGWTSSVDLKNIVSKDYILSNQYCTIFMKDPDDGTFVPGVPLNNLDSLVVGNVSFGQGISFWSRESSNPTLKPKLIITYCLPTASILTETACDSFTLNSQTYNASGVYTQTLTNVAGCDSTITLNLTINSTVATLTETACDSYTLNSQTYTASGVYTQTLTNVAGCDSAITLNLTINIVDTSVTQIGITIGANAIVATYQWIDCDNGNAPIAGEINQNFTATANGNYAVIVTQNTCSDTSHCVSVTTVGLNENSLLNTIHVFPNPCNGVVTLSVNKPLNNASLKLLTILGQVVMQKTNLFGSVLSFDITEQANGMYFIEVNQDGYISRMKLVNN